MYPVGAHVLKLEMFVSQLNWGYPNRFDADEMPSNGCEAGCPEVHFWEMWGGIVDRLGFMGSRLNEYSDVYGIYLANGLPGGGFKYYFVHPYLGKWSNLTNILQ